MAELTKKVATATSNVGSIQPLQANTGSDVGDALSALSFGLSTYSKFQQAEAAQQAAVAAAKQEEKISSKVLELRELRAELAGSPDSTSRLKVQARENALLEGLTATERVAAISAVNKLTKQSTQEFVSNQEKEALASQKRLDDKRNEVAKLAPYLTYSAAKLDLSTEDGLDNAILLATEEKAIQDYGVQQIKLQHSIEANQRSRNETAVQQQAREYKNNLELESFDFVNRNINGMQIGVNQATYTNTPAERSALIDEINTSEIELVRNFQMEFREKYNRVPNDQETRAAIKPLLDTLDASKEFLLGDNIAKMSANEAKVRYNDLLTAAKKTDPATYTAIILAEAGLPVQDLGVAKEKVYDIAQAMVFNSGKDIDNLMTELDSMLGKDAPAIKQSIYKLLGSVASNPQSPIPEKGQKSLSKSLSTVLSTDDEDFADALINGSLVSFLTSAYAGEAEGTPTFNPKAVGEDRVEVLDRKMFNSTEKFLVHVGTTFDREGISFDGTKFVDTSKGGGLSSSTGIPRNLTAIRKANQMLEGVKAKYGEEGLNEMVIAIQSVMTNQPEQEEGQQ